jgi:hypothetical protein
MLYSSLSVNSFVLINISFIFLFLL